MLFLLDEDNLVKTFGGDEELVAKCAEEFFFAGVIYFFAEIEPWEWATRRPIKKES